MFLTYYNKKKRVSSFIYKVKTHKRAMLGRKEMKKQAGVVITLIIAMVKLTPHWKNVTPLLPPTLTPTLGKYKMCNTDWKRHRKGLQIISTRGRASRVMGNILTMLWWGNDQR